MILEGIPNESAYKSAKLISYAELASSVFSTEWLYRKTYGVCGKKKGPLRPLFRFSLKWFSPVVHPDHEEVDSVFLLETDPQGPDPAWPGLWMMYKTHQIHPPGEIG